MRRERVSEEFFVGRLSKLLSSLMRDGIITSYRIDVEGKLVEIVCESEERMRSLMSAIAILVKPLITLGYEFRLTPSVPLHEFVRLSEREFRRAIRKLARKWGVKVRFLEGRVEVVAKSLSGGLVKKLSELLKMCEKPPQLTIAEATA